jgi:hypothetical protein
MNRIFNPERKQDEAYSAYKVRRQNNNEEIRKIVSGKLVWDSRTQGTFRKSDQE